MKKGNYQKVKEKVKPGTIEENHLPGPVITYTMSREEVEKRYGKMEPPKQAFCKGWPTAGQPNQRHIAKREIKADSFDEVDYIDPEWGLDELMRVFEGVM